MKVLCLGNNTVDTENKTIKLAQGLYRGLLSSASQDIVDGYYQTSVFDLSRADILQVAKKFDHVIILDQPKEQYNHPDSFYITIDLGKELSAEFLDPAYQDSINFFENLVKVNPSFCIFPFIELLVNNSHTTVCCRSNEPVAKLENLDYQNSPEYQHIRQHMLDGTRLPEHCFICYKDEELGIKSARQQETVEWANRLNLTSLDDLAKLSGPAYYEVRASNICNLQCRSCSPEFSSQIEREYKVINLIPNDYQGWSYTNFDFVDFTDLKKLYVAGGEPTAMTEFYDFLDRCIQENNTDFELVINTNGTKISQKLRKQLSHFTTVGFVVSVDALAERNRYVRWPADWDSILESINWITESNYSLTFNTTVSIYNISSLYEILEFLETEFPKALIHCQLVSSDDDVLSPFNFVNLDISSLEKIQNLKCYTNTHLMKTFVDGLIQEFQNNRPDSAKLQQFFSFNDRLDESRSVKLVDYIPELEAIRNEI